MQVLSKQQQQQKQQQHQGQPALGQDIGGHSFQHRAANQAPPSTPDLDKIMDWLTTNSQAPVPLLSPRTRLVGAFCPSRRMATMVPGFGCLEP